MTQLRTALLLFALLLLCSQDIIAQGEVFARRDTLAPAAIEPAGFGEIVAGVDFDGDGKTELYAVNSNWNDTPLEMIPRIYKYEWSGTTWDSVWSATLNVPMQNTWPALTSGDMDKDGRMEIIWGPVNFPDAVTNPNPVRIAVFEEKGDGSDVMGVEDAGNFRPNAAWTIADTAMVNLRPFRWVLADPDGDDTLEVVFCDRASSTTGYRFGIISVSNIPDNGDGSEIWRLEFSGKGQTVPTGTLYDLAVVDSTIYLFHNVSAGTVTPVRFRNGAYSIGTPQTGVVPSGAWKSAQVVDLDKDGTKEIVIGSTATGSVNNNVYLLQLQGDTLARTAIANLALGPNGRIYGGGAGDIDGDGDMDFVYGSREATDEGTIKVVKYLGGGITNPANYQVELADKLLRPAGEGGRYDIFGFANVDADADSEIVYGHGVGNRFPLVTLDRIPTASYFMSISQARVDANADFQPDNIGDTVQVVGVINSVNIQTTNFGYFMQDDSAGIQIFKTGLVGAPTLNPGDRVLVTGRIDFYRGTTEITPFDLATDIRVLDSGRPVTSVPLTIGQYKANPEMYESRRITLAVAQNLFTEAQWPTAGNSANLNIWDGRDTLVLRIDSDTEIDGSPFPSFPVRLTGVGTQFTSSASVYNNGYQITPMYNADFVPVNVPPLNTIALVSPTNASNLYVADSSQAFDFVWHKAVDFNNDPLIYQFKPVGFTASPSNNSGADTVKTVTGKTLLGYLAANDSLALRWTVQAKDPTNPAVTSTDTFMVMLRKFPVTPGWSPQTSGVTASLRAVKAVSPMVAWFAGQAGTVLRTVDGGQTWQSVGGGPITTSVSLNNIEAVNDQVAFVVNQPDTTNMYRTTNGGQTWERVYFDASTGAFLDAVRMYDAMNGIALGDPVGGKWVILQTTDGGTTWARIATEPAQIGTEAGWLNSLATVGTTHIWFGTNDSRIYRSTDGGATWSYSATAGVNSYSVWFNDTQFGVAGFSDGTAAVSSDGGTTWSPASLPAGTGTVFGIAGFGKDFWLTRANTVFHSTDRGATWTAETTAPSGTLRHISFVKSGSYTAGWTGTSTGAILHFSGTLTDVKIPTAEEPVSFALEQNYPNPFNPSTTIRYLLPTQAYVSVKIYDVLGREVATLLEQDREAGVFEVVWNGDNSTGMKVASGMYIYRMEARPSDGSSPFVSVKKMMLLK